jgi:phage tail-like protein
MSDFPLPVFHFEVEWGGSNIGFSEVAGLNIETQVIEYRTGDSKDYAPRKMPGIPKWGNITLKRGIVPKDNEFYDWLKTSFELRSVEKRDLTIKLLDENHDPTISWSVHDAFPIKVEGPGLKSTGNEVAIESLEIAHEGIEIIM